MGFRFSGAQVRQGSSLDGFATLVCKQNASKDHPARAENDLSQMPIYTEENYPKKNQTVPLVDSEYSSTLIPMYVSGGSN